MVKVVLSLLLLFSLSIADELFESQENNLTQKIKSFLDKGVYERNEEFINIVFDPESDYYTNRRVDVVKVVETLKENGLLNLFYKSPKEIQLNFITSGSPLFFVKLMGDTLRNIGYYRYVTTASTLSSSEFTWSINLTSEYATDPLVLQTELNKSGSKVIDIDRKSQTEWTYVVDMGGSFLNLVELEDRVEIKLKRSLYAHWLNVSKIEKLKILSSRRNNWYPYIAYYDASLHLLKVIKEDERYRKIDLEIPKEAKYIKISDLYSLKNVKDELTLQPSGNR
ncbi:MAG: hypothetical protein U9Q40_07240 [Campylobacterota bacterium]|nr:hypothetical protein [Campylobacterota bacterium]